MLWGRNACAIRLLTLCLLGYVGLLFGISQPSPDNVCNFTVLLRNFRPVISWKLRDPSIAPTHYTLWYTDLSNREMEIVEHCANITSLSCDVTHLWEDLSEMYEVQLVGSRGNATLVRCFSSIFPELDMHLEPPEFEIAGFTDHIRVTLAFPPARPEGPEGPGLWWWHFPLVIEERLEGVVKKHNLELNEDTKGNFTYVLDRLIPNTTYCVSVYFSPRTVHNIIRSPLKCTHLQPAQRSGSPEPAGTGALVAVVIIVVVSVSALVLLRRVGYICLRSVPPKVLKFQNLSAWVFPELPPLETVAVLEVININRKKKVWDYNYDDESDSDETVLQASAGGYTMHRLAVRPVCLVSGSSAPLEDYSSPSAQEDELSEPETQSPVAPEPRPWCSQCAGGASEGLQTPPTGPLFKEDSGSTESSADRNFFNVNLNSVSVRVLDDSDTEVPRVPSPAEETVDPEDPDETGTSLPVASAQGSQLPFPGHPGQGLWFEDAPSDRSDTSESDVDSDARVDANVNIGDGYLMR
ncbi:interferon alpha/beta receptor 2 [Sturnira hondurensis]|uniref:interferon alpha/beta receptor 2 n=1 Tax=Sturnira hondurensis TaxID=192404 RepID=UPI00187AC5B8|nr:interferon alpha/beta receptor 2 [Sturnira hondurensis]